MFYTIRAFIRKIFKYVTSLFLNGLLTILPIFLTIALFNVSFKLIKSWLEPIQVFTEGTILDKIPHAEIILTISGVFFIGTILRFFLLRSIVKIVEDVITRIPLIRPVYKGIKQLVAAFSLKDKMSSKQVVLIEFPRKGLYSLGLMTSQLPADISPTKEKRFFNVFVPTTPNPTSGYFVILPEEDISIIDLTRQEAMALIISGGIIQPDRFKKK